MDETHEIPPFPRAPLVIEHETGDELEEAAIDNLVEQYGNEAKAVLKFYRVKRGEPDALLEQVHPAEFDFLHLAKKYGRGTYRMKLFTPDPARGGRLVQRMNRAESYEGEIDAPAIVTPASVASGGDAIDRLALTMAQGFQELGKLIVSAQPKPQTMEDMLRNMALMREAMGMNNAPSSGEVGIDKMLGLLQQGIDLGKDLAGNGGDGEGSFMKVAEKTLPHIAELVGKAMERQPTAPTVHAPPAVRPPLPRPAPLATSERAAPSGVVIPPIGAAPEATASTYPSQPQENPDMFGMNRYTPFKAYVTQMADIFQRNPDTDPYAYAVLLLDNIGDMELNFMLSDAKLLDNLAEIEPRVNAQRALWDSLLATVRELTAPENEGTTAPHVPEQAPTNPGEPGPTH